MTLNNQFLQLCKNVIVNSCKHLPFIQEHVIVKAFFHRRAIAQVSSIMPLHGLTQNVSTGMPEHILACQHTFQWLTR